MPGRISEWPAWPEFAANGSIKDSDFADAKRTIIAKYGVDALRRSWIKTCEMLEAVTDEIAAKKSDIIPVLDTDTILRDGFNDSQREELLRIGSFVCRSTIPEAEADKLYSNLKTYVSDNKEAIPAWPKESPSMLMMYDSPVQNTLRSHPNQLRLQRVLNELWQDTTGETSSDPLVYLDGVRDRAPGQEFLGLGPHIDAGSFSRWADPAYAAVYDKIFSGHPEEHNCYDLGVRALAKQDMFKGIAHSSVFRAFQGWTALTPTASGEGTILVYPNVAAAISYVVLRPFFAPPENPAHVMDAEAWTLDGSSNIFPGTFKPDSQGLSRTSHPHLRLEECLVPMPSIRAGDTVWWHTDTCHAVDTRHDGEHNASVAYIAACPTTRTNTEYVRRQLAAVLDGRRPPDYASDDDVLDERQLKGYLGLGWLGEEARKAFGFA